MTDEWMVVSVQTLIVMRSQRKIVIKFSLTNRGLIPCCMLGQECAGSQFDMRHL